MNVEADKFLETTSARFSRGYEEAMAALLLGIATGNKTATADARKALEAVLVETMGTGEVLGASMMLRDAAKVLGDHGSSEQMRVHAPMHLNFAVSQAIIPKVTFAEALQDMVDRTPVTIRRASERTAQRIGELYKVGAKDRKGRMRPVVAFAHSAEAAVTKRVQGLIAQAIKEGIGEVNIGAQIIKDVALIRNRTAEWTESYARMAFRTNLNTAVTAGRFRQAQDPDIMAVVPCFAFDDVGDSDTRANHKAPQGLIFKVNNPVWNDIAPPLGYNCRCQVRPVSVPMLFRMGRIDASGTITESRKPSNLKPDKGFTHGGRPDLMMVGGG